MQKTDTLPHDVLALAEELGLGDRLAEIVDVTREMFPGPVTAETGYDPEWPEDRWISFVVEAKGSFKEILERQAEWHRRTTPLASPRLDAISLSIMPIETSDD